MRVCICQIQFGTISNDDDDGDDDDDEVVVHLLYFILLHRMQYFALQCKLHDQQRSEI